MALVDALLRWKSEQNESAAADLLADAEGALTHPLPAELWHEWLDTTARPGHLQRLADRAMRERWAEAAIAAIRASRYTLRTMLERRAAEHPERVLFEDARETDAPLWSYAEVLRQARAMAGVFVDAATGPRVAIFCENNVDGAIADLACLTNGIMVTPINVHTDAGTLAWMFDRVGVNVAVTDTDERQERIEKAAAKLDRPIRIFRTGSRASLRGGATGLRQACAEADLDAQATALQKRVIDPNAPATVMFTSGSTGDSKGLVFSDLMLVSKRFARAAALPMVGSGEVLLAYLPLFHTFGRYLEMLGMLFWHGAYVFATNPSAEGLLAELPRVQPTGLVSIPLRWTQVREQCLETGDLRSVVGDRLRWGLSAAGYLDPKVFRFFQRHGVELCSGFGMTEATGGITMTPPGEYVDGSVGVPLPGIRTRLTEEGELQISGVYVAHYLGDEPLTLAAGGHWVATGDLFRRDANGFYTIVDRIKDIYKNSRGQTVAPQRVEQQFAGVPGIRRVFLAGDHRDHNVLLVVPDRDDPVIAGRNATHVREYTARIIASVNASLAPYERVVNFALLERDFSLDAGELTPKGSFRRKAIETNFSAVIEKLYESSFVELHAGGLRVRVPRWLYRDLGIVEGDLAARGEGIVNRRSGAVLPIRKRSAGDAARVRIGDLEYTVPPGPIDLGVFVRQPRLWLGNASLAAFAPCKGGWEVSLRGISEQVRLPRGRRAASGEARIEDDGLRELQRLSVAALFAPADEARGAVEQLGVRLENATPPVSAAIRRRLEALAWHDDEPVRAAAYRTLLLDLPLIEDESVFPSFLESGRSFLDEESIAIIAATRTSGRSLEALRKRLYGYRTRLEWPAPPERRRQLRRVFRLLAGYARNNRADFAVVQAELASWALFAGDEALAREADRLGRELTAWYDATLMRPAPADAGKIVFEFGIPAAERASIERMLFDPVFLRHSIASAFSDEGFDWARVGREAVWVSPMLSHQQLRLYRLGINLDDGRHFDLLLVSGDTLRRAPVRETILWLTALSGHALGTPVLPRFGAWRRDLGAITVAYVSDLTAWERVREISSQFDAARGVSSAQRFRKIYVRAMAAFFRAWEQSGYRIVPGALTPSNVALPDADFHERTHILSLAGWKAYDGPMSIVRPLSRAFYRLAEAHYPPLREILRVEWIFDACIEALGEERAAVFFDSLAESSPGELTSVLARYREQLKERPHVPLAVIAAIDRFHEWERMNPVASAQAREEAVMQMAALYRLQRFPDAFRYELYRRTYFERAGTEIDAALERLILRRLRDGGSLSGHLEELSAVQALLRDAQDRAAFSRMVFPHARRSGTIELQAVGAAAGRRVIARTEIADDAGNRYVIREPLTAAEIGQLYRLFAETDYPIEIGEQDSQLIIADAEERIVGGLCSRWQEGAVVYIDGVVVAGSLVHRGLGGRLLEDFATRMAADGAHLLQTNFFLGGLFTKHGFRVDERWGGLVRVL